VYDAYDEIGSVIHTHPVYATMFAVTRLPIPAIVDEFTMYVGGEVPVCDYAPSGTDELADNASAKLEKVGAALLANHGMVAAGPSLSRALHISALVERAAQILWGARSLGELHPLPEAVNDNFRNVYGLLRTTP
jgi:L-fuculose-phosphate aldolase